MYPVLSERKITTSRCFCPRKCYTVDVSFTSLWGGHETDPHPTQWRQLCAIQHAKGYLATGSSRRGQVLAPRDPLYTPYNTAVSVWFVFF
jgi:hypothetical protein